ncbi:MAG TPA: DUF2243 domain-containing protein [Pseudonocardiaceae bacterium]|nr:DUF2243 domain-containing protein [Pseudonocardiaceae bacterium]
MSASRHWQEGSADHDRPCPTDHLPGLGAFQLFDGIVNHKLLRIHQIRYGVDILPYDLVWNGAGLVLLAIGAALAVRAARHTRDRTAAS